jgi:hypothetical protein
MLINIIIHHGGIVHHDPFSYVGGDIHEIKQYDIDYISTWEIKKLVHDLGYVNKIRCWYNVCDNHQDVLPLHNDSDIINFINVVQDYIYDQVHLYVEHMVDYAIMVEERFLIKAHKDEQHAHGDGDGDGEVEGEGGGGVDELHSAAHEDGGCKGSDGECDIHQSCLTSKSPRVKTRAGRSSTPSKKMTSTVCASPSGQASNQPSNSRGGT